MRSISDIIIHCTDTYPEMDIDVETIRKWHVEERGWDDVGYHYVIKRNGTVQEGRNLEISGAHAVGYNQYSIGIAMVGGKERDKKDPCNFTEDQWNSLAPLVQNLVAQFPTSNVIGHNDVSSKTCPTFDVKQWWKTYE